MFEIDDGLAMLGRVPRRTNARNLDRFIPIWMAYQNANHETLVIVAALDNDRIPNLLSAKPADALADPHRKAIRPGSEGPRRFS